MTDVITEPTTAPAAAPPVAPNYGLTKFLDPLRIPPVIRPHSWWHQEEITINMTRSQVRLHSQLPLTTVWAYEGQFPGPTIEVRSGKRLRVAWRNDIEGEIPLVAVRAPIGPQNPANVPGYREPDGTFRPGHELIEGVADLPAWTVVHLHGALTNAWNDGWAHNATLPGHTQLTEYANRQPSTTLWYHDHAMAVTRFNVHAGLAGLYLVRDDEEDGLDLPDRDHEVPLVLSDRNLDTDPATGALTGQLLFKAPFVPANGAMIPFTGPFNLVNGIIWPHMDVDARWYRFRVLNAANSRFYRLNLVDENGAIRNDAVRVIGTDGGLLPAPAPLPDGGLVLAPAERADILVDFSRFRGQRLRLTNTNAPVGGPVEPDLMEFRVENRDRHDSFELPEKLSASYVRLAHGSTLPKHDHAFVALVPPGSAGEAHPQMWELREITGTTEVPTEFPAEGVIQLVDPGDGRVRTFRRVATLFDETNSFFFDHNEWVMWSLIHLGGPAHPIHIHMSQFQLLSRRAYPRGTDGNVAGFDVAAGGTTAPLAVPGPGTPIQRYEEGWKDTFQVQSGEWVEVAGQFAGATGQFMYHCHILDHEDEGMMRPFVVHPPEVARFHVHPGGGHGHE